MHVNVSYSRVVLWGCILCRTPVFKFILANVGSHMPPPPGRVVCFCFALCAPEGARGGVKPREASADPALEIERGTSPPLSQTGGGFLFQFHLGHWKGVRTHDGSGNTAGLWWNPCFGYAFLLQMWSWVRKGAGGKTHSGTGTVLEPCWIRGGTVVEPWWIHSGTVVEPLTILAEPALSEGLELCVFLNIPCVRDPDRLGPYIILRGSS